jgi:hypothetical protein
MNLDINIPESSLLYASYMKHVAAYLKVNKRQDQMMVVLAELLEREARSLETSAVERIKNGI